MVAILDTLCWILTFVVLVLCVIALILALIYGTYLMIDDMGLIHLLEDWIESRRKKVKHESTNIKSDV